MWVGAVSLPLIHTLTQPVGGIPFPLENAGLYTALRASDTILKQVPVNTHLIKCKSFQFWTQDKWTHALFTNSCFSATVFILAGSSNIWAVQLCGEEAHRQEDMASSPLTAPLLAKIWGGGGASRLRNNRLLDRGTPPHPTLNPADFHFTRVLCNQQQQNRPQVGNTQICSTCLHVTPYLKTCAF